MNSKKPRYSTN